MKIRDFRLPFNLKRCTYVYIQIQSGGPGKERLGQTVAGPYPMRKMYPIAWKKTKLAPGAKTGPPDVKVLLGDASVLALTHAALAVWAGAEGQGEKRQGEKQQGEKQQGAHAVMVVDCGGFFDAYRLGVEARRRGLAPLALLERIQICRAFTGYQELRALLELRRQFGLEGRAGGGSGRRLLLLNPLHPLLDPDLPKADRPWLLRRLLDGVAWYGRGGYTVRIAQCSVAGHVLPEAEAFQATLARRFPLLVASRGRIIGVKHGQEHHPLFPRGGSGGGGVFGLPPGVDAA